MSDAEKQLKELSEIRSLMERSSRFLSLSGLSGVAAGFSALIGAAVACWYLGSLPTDEIVMDKLYPGQAHLSWNNFLFLAADGFIILLVAVGCAYYFTNRNAKRNTQTIWDTTARRLLINLAIPLVTGGIVCLVLIYHRYILLVAPFTLIFYGLALVNASKYTLEDIRYLGFSEIMLGLIAIYYTGNGMIFWMIGFGVLHILYGTIMYFRYER